MRFDRDLRFLLADGAGMAEAGLTKETIKGKLMHEAFPPETCAMLEPHYRAALAGEVHGFELAFAGFHYESHTLPVRDEQGAVIAGIALSQNITARKQAERKITDQLAELRCCHSAMLDRSDRSQELKREVTALLL